MLERGMTMTTLAHITTGVVSATGAILVFAVWQLTHSSLPLAKVDILGIVASQQKNLTAQMKPGMDQKAQAEIIESASRFGKQLDLALTQVAGECKCTLMNSAAIVKDSPQAAVPDYTQRVTALMLGKK
jgi:hypothetical protein